MSGSVEIKLIRTTSSYKKDHRKTYEGVLAMSPMSLRAIKTSTSSNPKDIRKEKKRERRKLSD